MDGQKRDYLSHVLQRVRGATKKKKNIGNIYSPSNKFTQQAYYRLQATMQDSTKDCNIIMIISVAALLSVELECKTVITIRQYVTGYSSSHQA